MATLILDSTKSKLKPGCGCGGKRCGAGSTKEMQINSSWRQGRLSWKSDLWALSDLWPKNWISKAWAGNMVEQKLAVVVSSMRTETQKSRVCGKHNRLRSAGVHVQDRHTETVLGAEHQEKSLLSSGDFRNSQNVREFRGLTQWGPCNSPEY